MYLNDHLCSPSHDHVNQRVCKKCTKEPPKRKVKPSIVVHALLEVIVGGSVYLNDHLCSPSRDRVNQRVCKMCTKEPPKRKVKPSIVVLALLEVIVGGSVYLNAHHLTIASINAFARSAQK